MRRHILVDNVELLAGAIHTLRSLVPVNVIAMQFARPIMPSHRFAEQFVALKYRKAAELKPGRDIARAKGRTSREQLNPVL